MRNRISIGPLWLWSRASDGALGLAGWHPRDCPTWHWSIGITRKQRGIWAKRPWKLWSRASREFRRGQWHDYYRLPFGYSLYISRQDWHLRRAA